MKVTLIARQGQVAVVQWLDANNADAVKRSIMPLSDLRPVPLAEGEFNCEDPELGIPYGVQWSEAVRLAAADNLTDEMHRAGIWTARDALEHVPAVEGALRAALGVDLQTILALAFQIDRESQKED